MESVPGIVPVAPELQPLGSISPSRFIGLQMCSLREVLAANHTPALLPTAPSARLGSVVHRLLELAGRGYFVGADRVEVEARWEELLRAAEQEAARSWLDRHLLPLSAFIPDFEVRRLRALAAALAIAANSASRSEARRSAHPQLLGYELDVVTPDGRATGRIDAVIQGDGGPVLRDYKSGAIHSVDDDGNRVVREEYASQLKLYAAMYAEMSGIWPVRLELVPVGEEPESIDFTIEECTSLLTDALCILDRINGILTSGISSTSVMHELAGPAPSTCMYCTYRPLCAPYADARTLSDASGWPNDVRGELREIRLLGNGRLIVALDTPGGTVWIRGLDPDPARHPILGRLTPGDSIAAFGLRPSGTLTSYSEGPFSAIYGEHSERSEHDSTTSIPPQNPGAWQ